MKKLLVLFFVLLFSNYVLAESSGSKITTGFKNDNYGTSFYYDEDNYYNDGWHLIDDNGDGISNTQKNTRNHCEFIYNSTLSPIGVFGWGNVKKKADSRARLSIRTNSSINIKYVFNSEDGTYYSALYRKKVQ